MWKRPVPLHIPVRKISFAGRRFKYDVRTGKQAGQARVCRMINHASVTCVMQFHLVRVPVKLIFLAKPKFVLAVGCYAYRPDTASVAGTLEGYESILRYVLHHAGGIFILKRPGNRLVRHTESLGIIHYPAFIGRNHDVPGTYDAIHKERQGLAFPTLTGGNIVRVSNIIRTISPFRLPLGIHGIDKTPGNRGMRFQFGSVQSVFRRRPASIFSIGASI